jgi:transglutaminase-like putative cysteine protease
MGIVSIRHLTTYRYRNPVTFGEHRMMLRPMDAHDQRILSAEVAISPDPCMRRTIFDASGSSLSVVRFARRADALTFESRVKVDHRPDGGFELEDDSFAIGTEPFQYDASERQALAPSIVRDATGEVEAWARRFLRPVGRTRVSTVLVAMCQAIRQDFTYALRLEGAPQTSAHTLELRSGSCRDFAVLMMDASRSLGLAARFVSGYVYSSSPKSGHTGGGHTHAWVRVYVPGCGWIDFDPTNGLVGGHDLIRVSSVIHPREALPLHGTWAGLPSDYLGMDVEVEIAADFETTQLETPWRVAQAG